MCKSALEAVARFDTGHRCGALIATLESVRSFPMSVTTAFDLKRAFRNSIFWRARLRHNRLSKA
jgi:hypothetical protein